MTGGPVVICFSELEPRPHWRPDLWGPWKLDPATKELYVDQQYRYAIDLESIRGAKGVLEVLYHIWEKRQVGGVVIDAHCIAGLVTALKEILGRFPSEEDSAIARRIAAATPKTTTLYRFFDEAGDLLYVGISERGDWRFREHRKSKPWWRQVASSTMEHFDTREDAEAAEARAIAEENPRYNIQGRAA